VYQYVIGRFTVGVPEGVLGVIPGETHPLGHLSERKTTFLDVPPGGGVPGDIPEGIPEGCSRDGFPWGVPQGVLPGWVSRGGTTPGTPSGTPTVNPHNDYDGPPNAMFRVKGQSPSLSSSFILPTTVKQTALANHPHRQTT
jgi:hypothetical protein